MHRGDALRRSPSRFLDPAENGLPLPPGIRATMEEFFGTRFTRVRVHESEVAACLGARAFAYGNDIVFAPGAFDTASFEGLRMLGHELAHVVQQREGRAAAGTGVSIHVDDNELENEADVLGARAARWFLARRSGGPGASCAIGAIDESVVRPVVQCMITLDEFKEATKAPGIRNKIKPVEIALSNYLAVVAKPHHQRDMRDAQRTANALRTACETYHRERPNSGRKPGVDLVVHMLGFEAPVIDKIVEGEAVNGAAMARRLMEARELMVDASRILSVKDYGRMEWLNSAISQVYNVKSGVLKQGDDWSDEAKQLVMEDIERLQHMSETDTVPGLIRAMLKQIIAARIKTQISPGLNTPGAKYNETRGPTKKYTLNHRVVYDGGLRMRLGALVHELTHVCVAEAFGHSVVMLAVPRDATDEEILGISQTRRSKLEALKALVGSDPEINNEVFGRMGVKANINTQIDYASSSKLRDKYLKLMEARLVREEGQAWVDRIHSLCERGLGAEVVEYDSVINQSLIWCHLHEVPPDNAVYKKLAQLAAENMARLARAFPKPRPPVVASTTPAPVRPPGTQVPGRPLPGAPRPVYTGRTK